MKKIKKLSAVILSAMIAFSFTGCGDDNNVDTNQVIDTGMSATSTDIDADALVTKNLIDPLRDWRKYDELVEQIRTETDFAKRVELMHDAEDILMATYNVIPVYYSNFASLEKPYVKGVYVNSTRTQFFMDSQLENGADALRMGLGGEPTKLDPALCTTAYDFTIAVNSFAGLCTYDATGNVVLNCAESITASNNGLTYTVKLRDGLKWSDGSDLTAEDFVYSWKRAANPDTGAPYAYLFEVFEGYNDNLAVSAIDSTTLEFELKNPCAYIQSLLALPIFYPVKQSAVESYEGWQTNPGGWCTDAGFVSNGAYTSKDWRHGQFMRYEKNPNYHHADEVKVQKLEYMLSEDSATVYAAYTSGDLDIANLIPSSERGNLYNNPEVHKENALSTRYILVNAKSPLFEGKTTLQAAQIREAISMLIDRDYVCASITRLGEIPANSFVPIGMADGNGNLFKKDLSTGYFDPYAINKNQDTVTQQARDLLTAAGYKFNDDGNLSDETPITLEYITPPGSENVAFAESLQQDLGSIGIEVIIRQPEFRVFYDEVANGNYELAYGSWIADFDDPINMLEIWTTASGNNDVFGK